MRIRCAVREHLIAIHVEDDGHGIAEDKLEEIFEPFVQLSSGLTRTAEGSSRGSWAVTSPSRASSEKARLSL